MWGGTVGGGLAVGWEIFQNMLYTLHECRSELHSLTTTEKLCEKKYFNLDLENAMMKEKD